MTLESTNVIVEFYGGKILVTVKTSRTDWFQLQNEITNLIKDYESRTH